MRNKGISLPIEMIVIIAIAVLVLVVIATLFLAVPFDPEVEQAFNTLCTDQSFRCGVTPDQISRANLYDLDNDGTLDSITTLQQVCAIKGLDVSACRQRCGC